MLDSEMIFGATNLTEEEMPLAIDRYKLKWASIYPLRTAQTGSTWLFGRGQDDMVGIQAVEVKQIEDMIYRVFIDYGDAIKTLNRVVLVSEDGVYKIDFCETEFVE